MRTLLLLSSLLALPLTACAPVAGAVDCGFSLSLVHNPRGDVLQLASEDGGTCVRLERRDDSEPDVMYKAVPYTLLTFTVGYEGEVETIDDEAALEWRSTHHNWGDSAAAEGERALYELATPYADDGDNDWRHRYHLSALGLDTRDVIWGPVELFPAVIFEAE